MKKNVKVKSYKNKVYRKKFIIVMTIFLFFRIFIISINGIMVSKIYYGRKI